MGKFGHLIGSEWLKMRKSSIWLLIFVSPALSSLIGLGTNGLEGPAPWANLLAQMAALHAMLLLPLLAGVFAAFLCRYEHGGGGWKQLLALPVSRTKVYVAKYTVVLLLLAATQVLFLVGLIVVGSYKGIEAAFPWDMAARSIFGGWVATLPLAALQLLVSVAWASFAAPLALNVILTLPNVLIAFSERYGPFDPWAQPMLAMLGAGDEHFGAFNMPLETLGFVVGGSFIVFFLAGVTYFRRKEV